MRTPGMAARNRPEKARVFIKAIDPDSPAAWAGAVGDAITAVDEKPVKTRQAGMRP